MNPSLFERLERIKNRLAVLDLFLSSPEATQDMDAFLQSTREHAELSEVVACFKAWERAVEDCKAAEQMLLDPELRDFAEVERSVATASIAREEFNLKQLLLPKDPDDDRDLFLEIRAGTGGEESALFSADLLRMYLRFGERRGWQTEIVSANPSELGGYKEVIVRVSGERAYAQLKFESGGHRVQRIPDTEAQGRVHTSACTVAVMPEADPVVVGAINPEELRIDYFRASGAGGQHVNRTESAVRITHRPTGLVVECQDDRSQHRNRAKAMQVLGARLQDLKVRQAQTAEAAQRRLLVGSGDRSERIRTYNFPQGRLTDHRINLTVYKLAEVMDGDLDGVLEALSVARQVRLLEELADEQKI